MAMNFQVEILGLGEGQYWAQMKEALLEQLLVLPLGLVAAGLGLPVGRE